MSLAMRAVYHYATLEHFGDESHYRASPCSQINAVAVHEANAFAEDLSAMLQQQLLHLHVAPNEGILPRHIR